MKASARSKAVKIILVILIILMILATAATQFLPTIKDQWAVDIVNSQEFKSIAQYGDIFLYNLVAFVILLFLSFIVPHIHGKPKTLTQKVKDKIPKKTKEKKKPSWIKRGLLITVIIILSVLVSMVYLLKDTEIASSQFFKILIKGVWIPGSILIYILVMLAIKTLFWGIHKSRHTEPRKGRLWTIGKIVGGRLLFILIFILVVYLWPVQKEVPVVADPLNSQVFEILSRGGIVQSNTIVENDVVTVNYQLPEGLTREQAELYILGVMGTLKPSVKTIIINTYSGQENLGSVQASMSDVLARKNGDLTDEELRERLN